ncbi:hypothetical protein A0J61_09813 [Choanephora cucurbitarum]|uniref:Uncharacterized protein n=1 Tax=Choanephora cucurbitarum TaxID=101091 RepID=A0A1C7MZ49_9FUNG|nr:hypothetical protein A0J61_09813 [Choanephora cucurbitarum]
MFSTIHIKNDGKIDGLIDVLLKSPNLGEVVKKINLSIYTVTTKEDAREYLKLAKLTPNLTSIETEKDQPNLYETVLQNIQLGYWKHLHSIGCFEILLPYQQRRISPSYMALAVALQDRLSHVMFDLTLDPSSKHTRHPLGIANLTPFNAAKSLVCLSKGQTSMKLLDRAITLCPYATKVTLNTDDLVSDTLTNIKPSTHVEDLVFISDGLTETYLSYISRKFPNVRTLILRHRNSEEHDFYFDFLSGIKDDQIVRFVKSNGKLRLVIEAVHYMMDLFSSFASVRWQGEMSVRFKENFFELNYDQSKPDKLELDMDSYLQDYDHTVSIIANFLGSLDVLSLKCIKRSHYKLLSHCRQLKTLCTGIVAHYNGPQLPITRLELSECVRQDELEHFTTFTPHLKDVASFVAPYSDNSIHLPSFSLDSFCLTEHYDADEDPVYICLIRSEVKTYYRFFNFQLREADASEYNEQKSKMDVGRVELTCKDVKRLELFKKRFFVKQEK